MPISNSLSTYSLLVEDVNLTMNYKLKLVNKVQTRFDREGMDVHRANTHEGNELLRVDAPTKKRVVFAFW